MTGRAPSWQEAVSRLQRGLRGDQEKVNGTPARVLSGISRRLCVKFLEVGLAGCFNSLPFRAVDIKAKGLPNQMRVVPLLLRFSISLKQFTKYFIPWDMSRIYLYIFFTPLKEHPQVPQFVFHNALKRRNHPLQPHVVHRWNESLSHFNESI